MWLTAVAMEDEGKPMRRALVEQRSGGIAVDFRPYRILVDADIV
jgi:hypothetical protein